MAKEKNSLYDSGVNSECKKCKERYVGCHANCDSYKQFREKLGEVKNKKKKEKDKENARWL